jgi:hypothetical protein
LVEWNDGPLRETTRFAKEPPWRWVNAGHRGHVLG